MLCSYKKIWNVLNPGLLQRVVNQCGSNAVQEEMKQFMDELCQLRKGTRLKEFSEVVGMPSVSDDDSIVNYRMSKEWEERTLEDAEILKRQHAWKDILQLVGAVKSSMILVWRIPRSHKEIFRQTPHSFFEEYEIKRVTLDGVTLFDSEGLPESSEERSPSAIERDTTRSPPGTNERRASSSSATLGKNPLEISYPRKLHEEKEQELLLAIKRLKGVEGKVPTPPVGEDYVQSRGIRYYIKYGCVGGNTNETMILVSVGDETPPGVVVKCRTRDATMAARAISKYGCLPSVVAGLHEELAADIMARASLILQDRSTDLVHLSIDTPGYQRSKEYHLKNIQEFFEQCQKPGVCLVYLGHSEKDTGNWCFKDGTISFREIFDLYRRKCPEKCLYIMPDCCHSGQWINDCATVLDGLGIPPCGHRAREQGVLIKVFASCKPEQEAVEPCYSVQGIEIDEDETLIYFTTKPVNEALRFSGTDFARLTCCRGPDEPCQSGKALNNWTWEQAIHGGLCSKVFIIRVKIRGKPAWHFVLLSDSSEDYKKKILRESCYRKH